MKNAEATSNLKHQISDLETVVSSQKSVNNNLVSENKILLQEKDCLEQKVKLLTAALYGKKSEKLKACDIEDAKQEILPNLFNEAEATSDQPEPDDESDIDITPDKAKKKRGRKPLPKDLPRKKIIHDLTKEQKICHCGCIMSKIGQEESEELEYIPAKLRVLQHIRYKYACRKCYENVQIAKAPLKVIDKAIASSSLIAYSLVSKFEDHLPFYRQSQMWYRKGIDLSDRTLCNQALHGSKLLELITNLLISDMIKGNYICSDETTLNVLLSSTVTNYMWVHHSGSRDKRAVIFDYNENRSGKCAERFLSDFKGIHQCDGYSGYSGLYKKEGDILRAGCMDHARRKFYDVYKLSGKKAGLAKDVLKELKLLYKIESDAKNKNLPPDKIKKVRQKLSKPILEKLKQTLIDKKDQVPEKSSLGKAIFYMLAQWNALTLYLEYGYIRISNADAERIIKPFVIGRKNWMFNKTESGAKASAVIYSIIETCKANKINSYQYLNYILPKLKEIMVETKNNPDVMTAEKSEKLVRELLPYNINLDLLKIVEGD